MKLTVVGLGLIGGSLALDLKASGFADEVVGVEISPAHAEEALKLSLVDRVEPLVQAVSNADLIVLAAPVSAMLKLLPQVLQSAAPHATVTDMGSTKAALAETVAKHPRRKQLVLSHPMAGTENSGPRAAHRTLFQGKTAVLCDSAQSEPEHLERVRAMYTSLGMRLIEMTSQNHDLHAAYVSHLSHISSFVLANTVLEKEKNVNTIFDLAGGGFESTVRLAKSSPEMWAPIFEQNRQNVLGALDAYIGQLMKFRASLEKEPLDECLALMTEANQIRRVLRKPSP